MRPLTPMTFCRRFAAILAAVLLIGAWGGCGRKMPPIQPGTYPPPAVKDLAFELQDGLLTLYWTLPAAEKERDKETPPVAFKVLRARRTASEAECQSCSVRFQAVGNVRLAGRDPSERLQFQDRLEPGYQYRYKVIGTSAAGVESKDSNIVHPNP
jgi:hypothetical protein